MTGKGRDQTPAICVGDMRPTGSLSDFAPARSPHQHQRKNREQRPHAAETQQHHAAEPGARRHSRKLALHEIQFVEDRCEIFPSLIGLPEHHTVLGIIGEVRHGARMG